MKTLALSDSVKSKADIIIQIKSEKDIPLFGLALAIAKSMLKFHKCYGYTNADTDQKVLLIQV